MKSLWASVKASALMIGLCLCSNLQAEDREQLEALLQNELMSVELKVSALNGSLRELGAKITTLEQRQGQLLQQKNRFQKGIEEQREALSQHLNAAYKMGAQEPIKLLLNQRDPSKFSRVFSYYNYFSQSRTEQIAAHQTSVDALDDVLKTIKRQLPGIPGQQSKRVAIAQTTAPKNSRSIATFTRQ